VDITAFTLNNGVDMLAVGLPGGYRAMNKREALKVRIRP
jgi:hypothetical protein